jgi:hypothetical protein
VIYIAHLPLFSTVKSMSCHALDRLDKDWIQNFSWKISSETGASKTENVWDHVKRDFQQMIIGGRGGGWNCIRIVSNDWL